MVVRCSIGEGTIDNRKKLGVPLIKYAKLRDSIDGTPARSDLISEGNFPDDGTPAIIPCRAISLIMVA